MIKQISLIITAAIFAACGYGCSKHHTMKKNLITDKNEFWDNYIKQTKYFLNAADSLDRSGHAVWNGSYTFLTNGKCGVYEKYSNKKGKRLKIFADDVVVNETWRLEGDSLLFIQGFKTRILSYKKDSFVLQNPITGDTTWLYKVRDKPNK